MATKARKANYQGASPEQVAHSMLVNEAGVRGSELSETQDIAEAMIASSASRAQLLREILQSQELGTS